MRAAPENPPRGPEAFSDQSDEGVQAQAAILLGIGMQLRGDRQKVEARSMAVAHPTAALMADELTDFPLPRLAPAAKRYPRAMLRMRTHDRFGMVARDVADRPEALVDMAADVYEKRTNTAAATLSEASLHHPDALVRVAAAHAALPVTTDPAEPVAILAAETRNPDELVREVAATALGRYMPEHPALQALVGGDVPPPVGEPSQTSMLVHGTWARNNAWYQPPGGDFWQYIRGSVWNDLYDQPDFYRWSGGYSDGARDLAADQLVDWITQRNEDGISLMCHSHGASVTMLASWRGVTFNRLVFLSSPVHPAKYQANFGAVQKVTSIRVKMDLVLLADGSGARFTDPRYHEHVLPKWFNHSATHDAALWTQLNIPAML